MTTPSLPAVSVILPVYNGAKYLKEAVESVLRQSFGDFELIIINDGSTDESLKIIQGFSDPRIIIVNQENKGLIATLNKGISISRANYIARIDADDIWSDPKKLERQMIYLELNSDCVALGTAANIIDGDGQEISRLAYPTTDREIRAEILIKNCFIHPSVVFSKAACLKAGTFSEQETYVEDYGLWLRMGQYGTLANLPNYLMSYRIHGENVTQQKNLEQSRNSFELAKKYRSLYPNFNRAYIKWSLKLFLLRTIGLKNFNKLKN